MGTVPTQNQEENAPDPAENATPDTPDTTAAPAASAPKVPDTMAEVKAAMAEIPRIEADMPIEERREIKTLANALSKQAVKLRKAELAEIKDPKEKKILTMYDQGKHIYAIAKAVYDFANSDTVGSVMLAIRKAHADDWDEIENVKSTKGYTGIGVSA